MLGKEREERDANPGSDRLPPGPGVTLGGTAARRRAAGGPAPRARACHASQPRVPLVHHGGEAAGPGRHGARGGGAVSAGPALELPARAAHHAPRVRAAAASCGLRVKSGLLVPICRPHSGPKPP